MKNSFFYDLGKAAFGTLDMVLEADKPVTVEALIGECRSGDLVDRDPGGFRYINIQQIQLQPGIGKYRFPLAKRPPWCKGGLISPMPDDEIAPFRDVEINGEFTT